MTFEAALAFAILIAALVVFALDVFRIDFVAFAIFGLNNTPAVAILIPAVLRLGHKRGRPQAKLLMPLSFASQLGGVVTLIGTSTNVLASSLSADRGHGAFAMFEFAEIGLLIFATGALYMAHCTCCWSVAS